MASKEGTSHTPAPEQPLGLFVRAPTATNRENPPSSTKILKLRSMRALVGIVSTLAWGLVLVSGASARPAPAGLPGSRCESRPRGVLRRGLLPGVPGNTCSSRILRSRTRTAWPAETCTRRRMRGSDPQPVRDRESIRRLAYFGAPRCAISDGVLRDHAAQRHSGQRRRPAAFRCSPWKVI